MGLKLSLASEVDCIADRNASHWSRGAVRVGLIPDASGINKLFLLDRGTRWSLAVQELEYQPRTVIDDVENSISFGRTISPESK